MSIHRTQFSPTRHGFHFANWFIDKVVTVTFPALDIPGLPPFPGKTVTKIFGGRCAGMSYAALDYYWNQSSIPTHTRDDFGSGNIVPDLNTGLGKYIEDRHNDWNSRGAAANVTRIILSPRGDLFVTDLWPPFTEHVIARGSYHFTLDQFADIRSQLDQATPVPVWLVADQTIESVSGGNHAVVAYGYDDINLELYVYNCNYPDQECILRPCAQDQCFEIYTDDDLTTPKNTWKGYCRQEYSQSPPVYFDLSLKTDVTCRNGAGAAVGSMSHGEAVTAEYTVVNTGQYTARLRAFYLSVLKVNHAGDETGIAEDHGLGAVDTDAVGDNVITLSAGQEYRVSKVSRVFDSAATYRIAASYVTTHGDMAWGYHRLPNVSDRTWLRIEVGLTVGDLARRPDTGFGHFVGVGRDPRYTLVKPLLGIGTDNLLYTRATLNAGTPQDSGWVQVPNSGYALGATVLPDGAILGIGTDNTFWTRATVNSDWVQVPNSGYVIGATVLPDGTILGIGTDNTFWTRATLNSDWVQVPNSGYVMGATVMRNGTILGVGTDHTLWTRATLSSDWVQVPNSGYVLGVTEMPDGTIVGVGTDNTLWTRAGLDHEWVQIPNSGSVIGVTVLSHS